MPKKKATKAVSKAVKQYVQKAISYDAENKLYNGGSSIVSGVSVGYNGTISLLSNVAQGTTLNTRIGMVIKPKYLDLRWQSIAYSASANNVSPTHLRVIVLQTRHSAATAVVPTPGEVLETVGNSFFTCSAYNDVTKSTGQYRILSDKVHNMDNGRGQQATDRILIPGKRMNNIHYVGGNGTDVSHGNIYILYGSDIADAQSPSFTVSWQLGFEDS